MKKRREFLVDESTLAILEQYRDENHLRSLAEALARIVDEHKHRHDIPATKILMEGIAKQVAEELSDTLTRIRLGANNADRNSDIILMLLNTLCSYSDYKTLIIEETPQLQRAREIEKDRIAHFRQKKLDKAKKAMLIKEQKAEPPKADPEIITDDEIIL